MRRKVLVSGSSGLVGSVLVPALRAAGHDVKRLVRGTVTALDQISWNPAEPLTPESVSGFDAVIHLAGESIAARWTEAKKRRIIDSRVPPTRNLAEALSKAKQRPRVFLCASAIGYYGDRGDEILSEDTPSGEGFTAELCRQWEAAAQSVKNAGIRDVQIRTGIVLSAAGGALRKMVPPFVMDRFEGCRRSDSALAHSRFEQRSGERGFAQSCPQCRLYQDSGFGSAPSGNPSHACVCRPLGLRSDGGRTPARQPEGATGQASVQRI
jgi:hypothetical protein